LGGIDALTSFHEQQCLIWGNFIDTLGHLGDKLLVVAHASHTYCTCMYACTSCRQVPGQGHHRCALDFHPHHPTKTREATSPVLRGRRRLRSRDSDPPGRSDVVSLDARGLSNTSARLRGRCRGGGEGACLCQHGGQQMGRRGTCPVGRGGGVSKWCTFCTRS